MLSRTESLFKDQKENRKTTLAYSLNATTCAFSFLVVKKIYEKDAQ